VLWACSGFYSFGSEILFLLLISYFFLFIPLALAKAKYRDEIDGGWAGAVCLCLFISTRMGILGIGGFFFSFFQPLRIPSPYKCKSDIDMCFDYSTGIGLLVGASNFYRLLCGNGGPEHSTQDSVFISTLQHKQAQTLPVWFYILKARTRAPVFRCLALPKLQPSLRDVRKLHIHSSARHRIILYHSIFIICLTGRRPAPSPSLVMGFTLQTSVRVQLRL